ncbi:MAG: hypothetical protein AAGB93_17060 [Planctomycetota bacterium]
MVSTTTADTAPGGVEGHAPADAIPHPAPSGAAPRTRLRNALIALFAIGVPVAWARDPQLVWQPLLPIPLLLLTPRGASRVLVAFVAVLVVIGGGVTTYRVGMAVPDWPATFQENMWTYPFEEMLAEGRGVTLEHVHRLWASALGLVSICVVLTCFIHRARPLVTWTAVATLVAVSLQGLLGGTRVLENSQNLAFLHGAIAQLVVSLIVVLAVVASRTWASMRPSGSRFARGLGALGPWVVALVYFQIALGAWLRHHGEVSALLVHGMLALMVVAMVFAHAKILGDAAKEGRELGANRRALRVVSLVQIGSLLTQFTLGVLATVAIFFISGGMEAQVSVGEVVFATAHVLVGSILLASTVVGVLYTHRALRPEVAA